MRNLLFQLFGALLVIILDVISTNIPMSEVNINSYDNITFEQQVSNAMENTENVMKGIERVA